MKRVFLFIGFLLISLACVGCNASDPVGVFISSQDNIRVVEAGKSLQLTAVVFPDGASQEVVWSSENESVAVVDENGLVTGVNRGKTYINATSKVNENVTNSFALIVEEGDGTSADPESISITNVTGSTTCKAGETIELAAVVSPEGASQSVIWSSSDPSVATVSRGEVSGLKPGEVTITATCKKFTDITTSITLTILEADKPEISGNWAEMGYTTHKQYETCADDTPVKIKGVVTHINPIKENLVSYFIQNGKDGYYVYEQNSVHYPVELGKVYEVAGYKKYYKGLNEVVNIAYCVEKEENISFEYVNLDNLNPSSLDAMKPVQASYVTANATFVSGTVNTAKAFSLTVKINNYNTTLRVDPAYASEEEFAAICELFTGIVSGTEFTLKGFMVAFGWGTPNTQIQIVKASDVKLSEVSDEDILNASLDNLLVASSVGFSKNTITLPTSIEGFKGITVSWASNSTSINVETGAVTHCESDVVVKLTATLTLNTTSITKEFTVTVAAADNNKYETLVSLDLEDAEPANQYGCSATKPGYAEANVTLGTPAYSWLFRNSLIANTSSDKYEGSMGIRAKAGADAASTARIEVLTAGEYNVVEFAAAVYGNHQLGTQIRIEYTTDNGVTWLVSETIITLSSHEIELFRVSLPEGAKRVAIVVVENSGKTVNIDSIKLMK